MRDEAECRKCGDAACRGVEIDEDGLCSHCGAEEVIAAMPNVRVIREGTPIRHPDDIRRIAEDLSGLAARVWAKVDIRGPDECWPWTGAVKTKDGRGCIWDGRRSVLAPRAVWMVTHGDIPEGMVVCHSCDNPPCVNPGHLWLGTSSDNMQDCARKGRIARVGNPKSRGETHYAAKVTESDVMEIRRTYVGRSATHGAAAWARRLGVAESTVRKIASGETWSPVTKTRRTRAMMAEKAKREAK